MNVLAPIAWNVFAGSAGPTKADWATIINRMVNNSIDADPMPPTLEDVWKIAPSVGLCHDFAVTKREILLHFGYHAGELLLCVCQLPSGEYHMVLLVNGMVLDNINRMIVPVAKMRYSMAGEGCKQQSVADPNVWEKP